MYLTLHLLASWAWVIVGDAGLCYCVCVTVWHLSSPINSRVCCFCAGAPGGVQFQTVTFDYRYCLLCLQQSCLVSCTFWRDDRGWTWGGGGVGWVSNREQCLPQHHRMKQCSLSTVFTDPNTKATNWVTTSQSEAVVFISGLYRPKNQKNKVSKKPGFNAQTRF